MAEERETNRSRSPPVEPESDSKHFSVIRGPSSPKGIRFKQRRVSSIIAAMSPSLPKMFHLSQRYPASRSLDVEAILREGLTANRLDPRLFLACVWQWDAALYVPAAQWEIKCGNNPHLWSRLEDHLGKHYEPGYAGSCLGPNPVDRMSLSERMREDASLLEPGQHVTGSFTLDSSVFDGRLKPGAYRLEAILYGWNQRFDNAQYLS